MWSRARTTTIIKLHTISAKLIADAVAMVPASAPKPKSIVKGKKRYPIMSNIGVYSANNSPKKPIPLIHN